MALSNLTCTHHASPRLRLLAQFLTHTERDLTLAVPRRTGGKKIHVVWYPMGGCSVHKPLFVRGPHAVQRTLCPQGRPRAAKTKRDTGKASGSLFPSEKPSSFLKEASGYGAGVWIKTEIHWKRQRRELARFKSSPNALGSMEGFGLAAGPTCQQMGLLGEVRAAAVQNTLLL